MTCYVIDNAMPCVLLAMLHEIEMEGFKILYAMKFKQVNLFIQTISNISKKATMKSKI